MSEYASMLQSLMGGILTGDCEEGLFAPNATLPAREQLAVYRDAYYLRLRGVIADTYPALCHHLGNKAFTLLADAFIHECPSQYFNLDTYPVAFGAFVASRTDNMIAGDIALLEAAIAQVYMAEESEALSPHWAASQTLESLATTALCPRTASALLALRHPVNDYINALRAEEKLPTLRPQPQYVMVYRHLHQVHRRVLEAGEFVLLQLLDGNRTLEDALNHAAFAPHTEEALQNGKCMQWFTHWIEQGCMRQPCQTL